MEMKDIQELSRELVEQAMKTRQREGRGACGESTGCSAREFVRRVMEVADRPHGDDGGCEDPVMDALNGLIYRTMSGAAQALGIQV